MEKNFDISAHLTYSEAIDSHRAKENNIANHMTPEHLSNAHHFAIFLFEPARALVSEKRGRNSPISVNLYRSKELNDITPGASERSQHTTAEAGDMSVRYKNFTNGDLFYIIAKNLDFDQLIWEFGNDRTCRWVHASYTRHRANRNKLTIAYKIGKETYYKSFKTLKEFDSFKRSLYK